MPTRSTARKLPSPLDASAEDQAVLSAVVDYYHATLADSPEALAYLARRKIDDPAVITRFRLGYANRTLGYRLPQQADQGGRRRARPPDRPRRAARLGPRAPERFDRRAGDHPGRCASPSSTGARSAGHLRAGHPVAPLPARSAPVGCGTRRAWPAAR